VPVVPADLPEVITINFGTELRPPNGAELGTEHTIEVTTPRLLPTTTSSGDE
jgi:hypothetical protein